MSLFRSNDYEKTQFPYQDDEMISQTNTPHENAALTTFLLIDDNEDEAVLMSRVFEHRNRKKYRLLYAKDGYVGLALAQQKSPTVIISDLVMPGMDGFRLVRALRSNPNTRNIPIVITSALDIDPDKRKELKEHVSMIYQKGTLKPSEFASRVIRVAEGK